MSEPLRQFHYEPWSNPASYEPEPEEPQPRSSLHTLLAIVVGSLSLFFGLLVVLCL